MNQSPSINRRQFLDSAAMSVAATAAASSMGSLAASEPLASEQAALSDASLVGRLYASLKDSQRKNICFPWDHQDSKRCLLRTFVANNWMITKPEINDEFYTGEQRDLIKQVFESIIHPEWHTRFYKQLEDDAGGFGNEQSIAIFGKPGEGQFEMVLTGRHMTLRCDGNSTKHVALGGPVFYGHAPDFEEGAKHIDNVFWQQAVKANELHEMLDGPQRKAAQVKTTPREQAIAFKGHQGDPAGLPVTEMSPDQKEHLQSVVGSLTEMFRHSDQQEVWQCLEKQGGIDACHVSFYTDHDIGKDGVWDNWRLEGPSFVWHFRGAPHVHVWVNIAETHEVKTNS